MDSIHFEDIPFEQIVNQASVPDFPMDRQGTYTRGELSSFPAYMHVELVNGYLITPPFVPYIHQCIITELLYQWTQYIKEYELPIKAVTAPFYFSRRADDRTVLLPDLAVVRHPGSILCPDMNVLPYFTVEVTTLGTNCLDHIVKTRIYKDWGIREYWIINPQSSYIETHLFQDPELEIIETYPFGACIPVRSNDGLSIDTSEFPVEQHT
ncbi:MAG: Uma2 family endonuclease [Faecalicatena sp.]|uniref:Uma2 family endonuclease n=1 Tax=Faecalicatena sp. TaxID=2005360 RepID=UPI0025871C1E|nr:Uma2 family endonuclease [Faecalicatena sp.]MCI6467744.1 Uma2 family endonuclease [Faecalicatena sp.]MDY5619614.1 Uma2 family endonuclease [Lachnospiraceae bacterium]